MNSIKVIFNSIDNFIPVNEDKQEDNEQAELSQIHEVEEMDPVVEGLGLSVQETNETNDNEIPNVNEPNEKYSYDNDSKDDELINPHYSLNIMFRLIYQIPYILIVKPLYLFWHILTYPFAYFKVFEYNYSYHIDVQEQTDLIKQENIISNHIKSPTSSSKYILPPPQRLFPLARNPKNLNKRKTLILDLDETLIHSLSKGSPRSLNGNNSNIIEIKLNNIATLYHVHKRPYCDYFLKEISKWFDLEIFTASVKEYADPIIDWLESELLFDSNNKVFKKRYYRNHCTYRNGVGYIKDLSKYFQTDDLRNVIILDNSPVSYALHGDNAVMIEGWINDQNDKDLLNLLPMLHSLSLCIDVRFILGLRQGEKVFENY